MPAAHVQSAQSTYNNSTSATATFGSAVSTGNLIFVLVGTTDAPTTHNTPTDSGSNTYTLIRSTHPSGAHVSTYYAKNVTGGHRLQ